MRVAWLALIAGSGLSVFARPARAQFDYNLCVFATGVPASNACGAPCDGPWHATIASALAAAEFLPLLEDGTRPAVRVCMDAVAQHEESVDVDNASGRYGYPLALQIGAGNLCPSPGADAAAPVVTFRHPSSPPPERGSDGIALSIDRSEAAACSVAPGPGILVEGPGVIDLDIVLAGTTGYGLANGTDGPPATVGLVNSNVLNCHGPAIHSTGPVNLGSSEISGCELGPGDGAALVWGDGPDAEFVVAQSALFGNLVDGSGGDVDGLLLGPIDNIHKSAFVANVMTDGIPLIRTGLAPNDLGLSAEGGLQGGQVLIWESTFSRNRHVTDLSGLDPDEVEPASFGGTWPACGAADVSIPWEYRPAPAGTAPQGSGPLVVFDETIRGGISQAATLYRVFFVENPNGAAPLLVASLGLGRNGIQLIQNTFASNGSGAILDLGDAPADSELVALRNLYLPPDASALPTALLRASAPPRSISVSMNVAPADWTWYSGPLGSSSVIGPSIVTSDPQFEDPWSISSASPCDRLQSVCPYATDLDCEQWPGGELPCPLDAAAEWIPTDAFVESLGDPWPWESAFFPVGVPGWEAPGATGGLCAPQRGTHDWLSIGWGDSDGYPDALDCDNEDASVIPSLPPYPYDGYASPYCDEQPGDCYSCPDGSLPVPSGDDDDSGTPGDDDSASPAGDDDSDADPPGSFTIIEGCHPGGGCGFAWTCDGAEASSGQLSAVTFLLPLPFALARRRRPPRRGAGLRGPPPNP